MGDDVFSYVYGSDEYPCTYTFKYPHTHTYTYPQGDGATSAGPSSFTYTYEPGTGVATLTTAVVPGVTTTPSLPYLESVPADPMTTLSAMLAQDFVDDFAFIDIPNVAVSIVANEPTSTQSRVAVNYIASYAPDTERTPVECVSPGPYDPF
jgi:hypothetical protein